MTAIVFLLNKMFPWTVKKSYKSRIADPLKGYATGPSGSPTRSANNAGTIFQSYYVLMVRSRRIWQK